MQNREYRKRAIGKVIQRMFISDPRFPSENKNRKVKVPQYQYRSPRKIVIV